MLFEGGANDEKLKVESMAPKLAPPSDGLIDAQSELAIDNGTIAAQLQGAGNAREMVERIAAMVSPDTPLSDDLTVLVLRKYENGR